MNPIHYGLQVTSSQLRKRFGIDIHSVFTDKPLPINELTINERKQFETRDGKRAFLIGRAALKSLSEHIGITDDTANIQFPNPHISLTHSDEYAIAVAIEGTTRFKGIGIDLDLIRPLNRMHGSYFLNDHELKLYAKYGPERLTQLWTIKESIFKSDGHEQDIDFKNYHIDFYRNTAFKMNTTFVFRSCKIGMYFLSICLKESSTL